jgi:hypothetical protein
MDKQITHEEILNLIMSRINELAVQFKCPPKEFPFKERYLDVQELCELLKIRPRTVYSYIQMGLLGTTHLNKKGKSYFLSSEVEKFLKENYVPAFAAKKNKRRLN